MFGLFVFLLFFTAMCLLISKPKETINLELTKTSQKQNNNATKERRHNTTEPAANQGVIFSPGFKPLGLLTDHSAAKTNNEATTAEISNTIIVPECCQSDKEKREYVILHPYREEIEKSQYNNFSDPPSSNYSTDCRRMFPAGFLGFQVLR